MGRPWVGERSRPAPRDPVAPFPSDPTIDPIIYNGILCVRPTAPRASIAVTHRLYCVHLNRVKSLEGVVSSRPPSPAPTKNRPQGSQHPTTGFTLRRHQRQSKTLCAPHPLDIDFGLMIFSPWCSSLRSPPHARKHPLDSRYRHAASYRPHNGHSVDAGHSARCAGHTRAGLT